MNKYHRQELTKVLRGHFYGIRLDTLLDEIDNVYQAGAGVDSHVGVRKLTVDFFDFVEAAREEGKYPGDAAVTDLFAEQCGSELDLYAYQPLEIVYEDGKPYLVCNVEGEWTEEEA